MLRAMRRALWPLNGLGVFLKHPHLWRRPFIGLLLVWIVLLAASIGVGWWWWPAAALTIWPWLLHASLALGLATVTALAAWIILLPLVMSFAMEHLAREVQRLAGAPPPTSESMLASLGSTLHVLLRTLPLRIAWMGVALIASFFGPLGVVVGAFAMAHMAAIDAMDTAMAARGIPGRRRMEIQRLHRGELIQGAGVGAAMNIGLGLTVLGWLLWLPAMVAGAAARVIAWPEVAALPSSSPQGNLDTA
jgi:hypothetical protein